MNASRRPWPLGERYTGFFRGPSTPVVEVRIRDNRDVRPPLPPVVACGDFMEDKDVPGYCEGCTQPKAAHTAEAIAGPSSISLAELREVGYRHALPHRFVTLGPTAQHKAECDCAEWYGSVCVWPDCEGGKSLAQKPSG